jgi:hypothetical protein
LERLEDATARWQSIRIGQLGFTTNVLIGLAAGLIAVEANLAFGKLEPISVVEKQSVIGSILLLLASIAAGILLAFNRLYDFRQTFKIVLLNKRLIKTTKSLDQKKIERCIDRRQKLADILGPITYGLLLIQSILFLVGAFLLYQLVQDHLKI